jgi:hypothetical protein
MSINKERNHLFLNFSFRLSRLATHAALTMDPLQSPHADGFLELGRVEATIPTGQRHRTVRSWVVYRLSHITCSVLWLVGGTHSSSLLCLRWALARTAAQSWLIDTSGSGFERQDGHPYQVQIGAWPGHDLARGCLLCVPSQICLAQTRFRRPNSEILVVPSLQAT